MSNTNKIHVDKIIIRESTLSDANEVAAIHVKSWQQSYRSIIDEHYLENISFSDRLELRNKILQSNDPNQIHLVAVYEETIIGFCDAGSAFESAANYRGEIYAIYLLEEFKKLGVGQRLLQAAHEFLAQKKLLPYVAWVLKANHSACAFYQKNGGIVSGEKSKKLEVSLILKLPIFLAAQSIYARHNFLISKPWFYCQKPSASFTKKHNHNFGDMLEKKVITHRGSGLKNCWRIKIM